MGDTVMTHEGPALVHAIHKNRVSLSWPKHHGVPPSAIYTLPKEDVWTSSEKPNLVYNSRGERIHEANLVEHQRVIDALVDPNDVVGKVPADQVVLPKNYNAKWQSPYLEMINTAENKEWKTLNEKHMFSQPIDKGSLSPVKQKAILRLNWIYKAKCDEAGLLTLVKARLVADGSREQGTLTPGEVYTPVMLMATVRAMLIKGIQNPLVRFHQLDVESAYATADCTREIYTYFPAGKGPEDKRHKGCVLRLQKALYGVIDSGRTFYEEWVDYHIQLGFQPIHQDRCYMMYYISPAEHIRLCFHVDDNIISQVGDTLWSWYQKELSKKYTCSLKPLKYCMGIEFIVDYDQGIIQMTQTAQIERMLRELNLTSLKATRSPVHTSWQPDLTTIEPNPSEEVRNFPMMAYIGHLNCLQQGTRPDITRALKIASKFARTFGEQHVKWVKHIVRYLVGTKLLGITLRRVAPEIRDLLQIWTDATHASDPDNRKSISGVTIKLAGNLLFWKANFQKIVSHSSTESELMALDTGATLGQYAKWICIAQGVRPVLPIPIYVDNSSAIDISTNPIQPGRNLHVHARYFYIRDLIVNKDYILVKIGTDDQVSDVLVTFTTFETFARLRTLLLYCTYCALADNKVVWNTTYVD